LGNFAMIYKLFLVKSAAKDYSLLNEAFKSQLKDNLNKLSELGLDAPNVKPLTGKFKGLHRIRSGDYRIIFSIENETITVVAILHRKESYKKK
jgi:mRNA interferase RelE/StbE